MNTSIYESAAAKKRQSVYMVLGCTVFAAGAQVLMKFGAGHPMPKIDLGLADTWLPFLLGLLKNWQLMLGYSLHACNALLLVLLCSCITTTGGIAVANSSSLSV